MATDDTRRAEAEAENTQGATPAEEATEQQPKPTRQIRIDGEDYDYTIDPMVGLPQIDLADEEVEPTPTPPEEDTSLRVGRAEAPPAEPDDAPDPVRYRASASDPFFGYIVAMAVSIGLMPLLPDGAPTRYTIAWGLLAAFGVVAWLLGNGERIGQEKPENLVWGVLVGVLAGTPLYLFGGATLGTTAEVLFDHLTPGALLAYMVFVMPLGETLFFRGLLQRGRGITLVGALATAWSGLLFFPLIRNLNEFWVVALFIGVTLTIVNMVYSWVRVRNGLAAAWLCQIVVNLILIFLPFVSR